MRATNSVTLTGGGNKRSFAQIGHGGSEEGRDDQSPNSDNSGNITVIAETGGVEYDGRY